MKKIRTITSLLVVFVFLAGLSACAQQAPATETSEASAPTVETSAPPASESKSDVTLTVMISTDWNSEAMQDVFARFQSQSGIKLDVQVLPGGQQLDEVILTKAATKSLPDITFMYGLSSFLKKVNASTNLVDLSGEAYISKISESVSEEKNWLQVDGKYYGIPASGLNVGGVIYNKKVFADLGIDIPQTWDDFLDACETIKTAGITPVYECGKDGWPLQVFSFNMFANMILKSHPEVIDELNNRSMTFEQLPEYNQMLEFQRELQEKGYTNNDILSGTYDESLAQVVEGKAAMTINADWAIPTIYERYPDANIGMFAQPYDGDNYASLSDPWAVGISANGNVEEAKEFLEFFASDENLNIYYGKLGAVPCYSGLKLDLKPGTADMAEYVDSGKALPFFSALIDPGFSDYVRICQEVYTDKPITELARELDEQRAQLGKAQKVPGWE